MVAACSVRESRVPLGHPAPSFRSRSRQRSVATLRKESKTSKAKMQTISNDHSKSIKSHWPICFIIRLWRCSKNFESAECFSAEKPAERSYFCDHSVGISVSSQGLNHSWSALGSKELQDQSGSSRDGPPPEVHTALSPRPIHRSWKYHSIPVIPSIPSGWWFQPLWKIWVRQLGWWHSQYKVIKFPGSKPPTINPFHWFSIYWVSIYQLTMENHNF